MRNTSKIVLLFIAIIIPVILGCMSQYGNSQFIVDEQMSYKQIMIDGWIIKSPILFSNHETSTFDTLLFTPGIEVRKPKSTTISDLDLYIDSILITFVNSDETFVLSPKEFTSWYKSFANTNEYKYHYFEPDNWILIPNEVNRVLIEFEATIKDTLGSIVVTQPVRYQMIRKE